MVRLVISDNEGTTTVVPLVRDEITIGRTEGNTIRLTERNISRRHAQLVRIDNTYKLRDLKSYNGVMINGQRVEGESSIKAGDKISMGDYTILIEDEVAKPAPVAEPAVEQKRPVIPARFIMLSEPSPGAEFALSAERTVRLGRSEAVDCPINHRSVSREHAEISCRGEVYTLQDLESANGIAVNGQAVKQHTLRSGDIVELGQVVFRYVAPGEHHFFDPADAARYRKGLRAKPANNTRWVMAILGAAVVLSLIIMFAGEDDPTEATAPTHPPAQTNANTAAATTTLADDGYDKSLAACHAAVAAGRYAEALAHATLALKVRPDAPEARDCRNEAQAQYEDEQRYVRGRAALQGGDAEAAYQELSRLHPESPFASRPEVGEAAVEVARGRLARAKAALAAGNAVEAQRIARSVLALPALPEAIATAANQLVTDSKAAPVAVAAAARPPVRSTAAARSPAASKTATKAAAPELATEPRATPMDLATACLARGDNECVIRALAGKANTSQELGLLIETYRAIGESKQAQQNMAIYVKRFPTARRADAYRHMLELQGQ